MHMICLYLWLRKVEEEVSSMPAFARNEKNGFWREVTEPTTSGKSGKTLEKRRNSSF